MKNLLIAILALTTLVVGYVAASGSLRMSMASLTGATVVIGRGDLTLPINATGEVRPIHRVVIKSEASGEVMAIEREPGERVNAGDLLITLRRDDEQRNVDRAKQSVTVAETGVEEAKNLLLQAESADIESARAACDQAKAKLSLSKPRALRARENPEHYHDEEQVQRESVYSGDLAQLRSAEATLKMRELAIPRAELVVIRQTANLESAQTTLGDALKQLEKTDIISPINGIVAEINVNVGDVIQGGKQNITGGTALAVVLDMTQLILQAEVDEADIGRVLALAPFWARPGRDPSERMPTAIDQAVAQVERLASISVETFPDEEFEGVIKSIYPEPRTLNNVTTYLVDVVISSNNHDKLLPGMRAEVEFTAEHRVNVVLCPNEAIRTGPNGDLGVYIPRENVSPDGDPCEFVTVKIGLTDGAKTVIREGLADGAVVYIKLPAKTRSNTGG